MVDFKLLDNPAWHSLQGPHIAFALEFGNTKFYHPDYCPFGGYADPHSTSAGIDQYASICNNFYAIGERPSFSDSLLLKKELVCNQMVIDARVKLSINESIIKLGDEHQNELFTLVNLVQPGYFRTKTASLGNYYGIFKEQQLIAVTGERMQMNKLVEVSAVVTHPGHTGKGYASQLIAHAVNQIFDSGKMPFLHVASSNTGAIRLYEKLGFKTRRKMSFWNLIVR
jgi:GNAT superfamily N-acetyltransferase